eukprot:CAMPEP_0168396552 /NCGR_PEP_ID=MMETSP0228-20121227/20609_1 /TAXON_ID=133427 /ORGANISM="Protoceratium reticulatum, Strain CCCM 535 (=CCMP 1889)" /LENGTH=242 /DNA_ID=CAMNT_0008410001 /DNA_START=1 /DNA_END=726 /DNA_ORIENTATION=-
MGRSTLATARCARGAMGRRSGRAQGRLAALLVFAAACATTRFHVFVAQGPTARGGARCKWNGGRECLCDNGASPCKYDSRAEASKAGTTVPRGAGAALSLDDLEPPELFDLEPAPVRVAEDQHLQVGLASAATAQGRANARRLKRMFLAARAAWPSEPWLGAATAPMSGRALAVCRPDARHPAVGVTGGVETRHKGCSARRHQRRSCLPFPVVPMAVQSSFAAIPCRSRCPLKHVCQFLEPP